MRKAEDKERKNGQTKVINGNNKRENKENLWFKNDQALGLPAVDVTFSHLGCRSLNLRDGSHVDWSWLVETGWHALGNSGMYHESECFYLCVFREALF